MGAITPPSIWAKIVRYLLLCWRSNVIVREIACYLVIVYRIQKNLFLYDDSCRFQSIHHVKGRSDVIHTEAQKSLIQYLEKQFYLQQNEMMWFLWEEWNLHVHRSTISRMLKKREWNNKKAHRLESQNEKFCQHWIVDLLDLIVEQLIFIDETTFNETTEWRLRVYASIDQSTRYHDDIRRERRTWSVLSIYIFIDRSFNWSSSNSFK